MSSVASNHIDLVSPYIFPVFFLGMWLSVTTMLGFMSGWFALSRRYPDQPEEALFRFRNQSGLMGPLHVGLNSILGFDVCRSGLRVKIWRIFGPFSQPFFVPWSDIRVTRRVQLAWKVVELRFGAPAVGRLSIPAHVGDRIATAASGSWPEAGPIQRETARQALIAVVKEWLAISTFAALFFIIAPRVAPHASNSWPPIWIAILFPATFFGVVSMFRFMARIRR